MLALESIELLNWRNLEQRNVDLSEGLTIVVGPNATGKTNIVEAIQLLTCGQTFRGARSADMVKHGCDQARVNGVIVGDGRRIDVQVNIREGRRNFSRNGKPCQPTSMPSVLPAVIFSPDDLDLVKGSPGRRRREIDSFGSCISQTYGKLLSSYTRVVEQRNRLLKEDVVDNTLVSAWDDQLITLGSRVMAHRLNLHSLVSERAREIYESIAPGEVLSSSYVSSLGEVAPSLVADEIKVLFEKALGERVVEERARRQTVVGPHRDDIALMVNDVPAREFCSQGQQRSIVLAWKIAEVEVTGSLLGQSPILLLDDVMSELDAARREALAHYVIGEVQTVVTTTNLGYFTDELIDAAKVVKMHG